MKKHIEFTEEVREGKKTKYWVVSNIVDGVVIGHVAWFGRWRQYAFFPDSECVFERNCLRRIAQFCEDESTKLRATWKKNSF